MVTFFFKVGKAFLKYTNHPITIPRTNNARLVEQIYEGSGKKTIRANIIPPEGRILSGEIYYGVSGYGPYYQIKVLGDYPSDYFGDLNIGDMVGITIERSGKKVDVKIISPQKIRKIAERLLTPSKRSILRKPGSLNC